ASAVLAAPAFVRGQNLNSKLQVASIGSDGKGWTDTKEISTHEKTFHVAFCDVDLARTLKVHELRPDAPIFQDYREMLNQLEDKIDAVSVSTPDHMHAYITLDALRRGKHVYCQKPLTHNVWESRQVRAQAKKSGVITRLGNQIHSHMFYRSVVKAIQEGTIGKVVSVFSWCAATGHGKSGFIDRPKNPPPVPDSLAWDNWIGVAPMRPYGGERVYHPWGWRDFQDFGNGAIGDFGCHIFDPVFTALNIVRAPTSIIADNTGMNDEVWPAQNSIDYVFPGTEYTHRDTIAIKWTDGGRLPASKGKHIPKDLALHRSGSIFVGTEGSIMAPHVGEPSIYPDKKFGPKELPVTESLNHYHGWVDGCISGKQPSDSFEYGGLLTEAALLGNIANRYHHQKIEWDEEAMKITNLEDANKWLKRDYRKGWEIEAVV
ncbi:MAG: Gfo/Idh/MocA family protein, partial [Verrucomicrobiales bacterium]